MVPHCKYRLTAAITSALITLPYVSSFSEIPSNKAFQFTKKFSSPTQYNTANDVGRKNTIELTMSSSSANSEASSEQTMRRKFLASGGELVISGLAAMAATISSCPAQAAETVGKDPDCNDGSCLGVWDGLLADCPHDGKLNLGSGAGCVSSQDDTPGIFAEPWDYSEAPNNTLDWEAQMRLLIPSIELVCAKRGDKVTQLQQSGRYLRVLFTDGKTGEESIGEFYFTPEDTTVQFRVGSVSKTTGLISKSLKNMDRCEMIRKELRYLKVPVLRNRKRALFFVESDFDTFGPGSAALGPPAEMTTGELEGRQDVDPKLKIDALQAFPVMK